MATQGEIKEQLAVKAEKAPAQKAGKSIKDMLKIMEPEIKKALPSVITPERFTRMVMSALSNNSKLAECTSFSLLSAVMNAAQLGLEPNTPLGQAYLIPFKNKGVMEVQFQVGYKGLLDLCYRNDQLQTIQAHIVYENDEFDYELGLDAKLYHKPALVDRGEPRIVYALFKLKNGGYAFEVMSVEDINIHAQRYSKAVSSQYSPWTTDWESMAKKTVIKKLLKYAPLKADLMRAVASDETIKTQLSVDMTEVCGNEIVIEEGNANVEEAT